MLTDAQPLPAFADAVQVVSDALEELRFPERITVSEAARRHRILDNPGAYSGPWSESPHHMGFTERASDALAADSSYDEVGVMGPAQTGKSEVGNNWQLHTILYDPADMLFVMPDKDSIRSYVTTQFTKMLDAQPKLRARQLAGPSSDNIALKQFRGCDFHFLHPSGPSFRARPISRGRLDDFDDIPTDIGDQGDAITLMRGRMSSFDAFGGTRIYVNSTPKLGGRAGIEAFIASGTDERWWVDCLMCGGPFLFDGEERLVFDRTGSPEDAAASVAVGCPECGGLHLQSDKRALMASGRWIGRGQRAVARAENPSGVVGELVPSRRLTQRWDGLMGMRTWATIASLWRTAELAFENEQDEGKLKGFFQTVLGKNYVPRAQGEPPVTEDQLRRRARASGYLFGMVPAGVLCLVAAIDLQVNRFEVAIWGFGAGFRAWLIDRFPISVVVEDGRERPLKPFTRPEDWAELHARVLSLSYPLADAPHCRMKIFNTAVDTGGLDNATDNAFAWWHSMVRGDVGSGRAPIPATVLTLIKGGNKPNARLLPPPTIDAKRQMKGAPQAEMFVPNVHRFKDIADTRLKRDDGGPGAIAFPCDVDERNELRVAKYLAEMRAEQNIGGVWVREPHRANETWDLYIYAYAVIVRFGGNDASLSWVPEWARPPKDAPRPLASQAAETEIPSGQEGRMPNVSNGPRPSQTFRRRGVRVHRGY